MVYGLMFFQKLRERQRVTLGHIHAGMERAHPAQGRETIKWTTRHARAIGPPSELLSVFRRFGDNAAADDIAMPVKVFRGRMKDEVCAQR